MNEKGIDERQKKLGANTFGRGPLKTKTFVPEETKIG